MVFIDLLIFIDLVLFNPCINVTIYSENARRRTIPLYTPLEVKP